MFFSLSTDNPLGYYHWCNRVVIRRLLRLAFLDVFESRFRYTLGYYMVMTMFIVSLLGCVYTIGAFDIVRALFAIGTFFIMIGAIVKYTAISDLQTLIGVSDFIEEIYKNSKGDARHQAICEKFGRLSVRILRIGVSFYGFFSLVPIVLPLILYALGGYSTDIRIQFPFIDQNAGWGRGMLIAIGDICNVYFFLSASSIDIYIVLLVVNMKMVSNIIVEHVDGLESELHVRKRTRVHFAKDRGRRLIRIVQITQKYHE